MRKLCNKCKIIKPVVEFYPHKIGKLKTRSFCINCYKTDSNSSKRNIKKYGLSKTDYDLLLKSQNNQCAICGTLHDPLTPRKCLFVDHSHSTLKIRGLLCVNCNSLLGQAKDDIVILIKAIEYLKNT